MRHSLMMFALFSVALMAGGAFLCCPFIDDSEAAKASGSVDLYPTDNLYTRYGQGTTWHLNDDKSLMEDVLFYQAHYPSECTVANSYGGKHWYYVTQDDETLDMSTTFREPGGTSAILNQITALTVYNDHIHIDFTFPDTTKSYYIGVVIELYSPEEDVVADGMFTKLVTYSPPTRTVTYNANGGTSSSPSATVDVGSSVTLPSASRTGYTFSGWYTESSGGTRVGGAGSSYTVNADTILYAHWSQNTLTASANNQSGISGQSLTNQISAVANNGATFTYAIKSVSAGTASVNSGGLVTFNTPSVSTTTSCNVVVTVTAHYPDGQTKAVDCAFSISVDPILSFTNSVTSGTLSIKGA